jgi:colanic acid/amylovoran biosynthesis glycosyltransferase
MTMSSSKSRIDSERRGMRIAFIVGGFPLISETFILNQITGLMDLGHEVDIYARRSSPDRTVHPEVEKYGLLGRTRWFNLPLTRWGRVMRAGATFLRIFPRHPLAMLRCLNLRRYGSVYRVLNNIMHAPPFLAAKYDVVMCHFGGNGIDFIFLKDLLPRLKFVTMFHKGDILLGDERTAAVYRQLPKQGDIFLAICESWNRRKLLEFGFDARRIRLHPIGVDTRRITFQVREPRGARLDILTVARLHPEKGIEHGLRAVAALIARRPDTVVRYRVIGDGQDRDRLAALVEALGLSAEVELVGPLPTPDVINWMHASHVFLLPSLAEATPTVLLEAQATGLPILATDVGGVRDIVAAQAGFLVPAADPNALADRLTVMVDHPERWPDMGRAGRRFVEERHDITDLDARLAALFEQVVAGIREEP